MQPILEMRGITKTFPGVNALENVNLEVLPAEIHAVVGENGAGKSTLMKVLSGVYPHGTYSGDIVFEGEARRFASIADSENTGTAHRHAPHHCARRARRRNGGGHSGPPVDARRAKGRTGIRGRAGCRHLRHLKSLDDREP